MTESFITHVYRASEYVGRVKRVIFKQIETVFIIEV